MLRLTLSLGDEVRHWPVPTTPVVLGSDADCDLHAPLRGISRRHVEISPVDRGLWVRDLGSTNGLARDGVRFDEIRMDRGESVRLGTAVLCLEDVATAEFSVALTLGAAEELEASRSSNRGTSPERPGSGSGPGSAGAALRAIREIEKAGGILFEEEHAAALRRSRLVLGAQALLKAVPAPNGELAIVGVEGALGEGGWDTALDLLARAPTEPPVARLVHERQVFLATRRSGGVVAALFVVEPPIPPARVPDAWQEDFFGFLAGRLLEDEGTSRPRRRDPTTVSTLERPGSELPAGMVLGESPALRGLVHHLRAIARSDLSVLVVGETGVGKELFARLVHAWSPVAGGPFIAVNCAAIPAELLEAELFGVVRGAATGVEARPGLLASADGGSILLDEIGDMPERLQAKILRVLETGEVQPVGSAATRKVQVRIIASTNQDLLELVPEGRFRSDLYCRLRGVELHVPPLRERREDIAGLALAFARRAAARYERRVLGLSRAALELLEEHPWPGNVRELENEVKRAVLLCPHGSLLETSHFGALIWYRDHALLGERRFEQWGGLRPSSVALEPTPPAPPTSRAEIDQPITLREHVEALERKVIGEALERLRGNRAATARELGVTRNGLAMKMRRLGMVAVDEPS